MNVKNLVLGVGIFVVYLLMLGYGIEAFYPSPKYEDYCNTGRYAVPIEKVGVSCGYSNELRDAEQRCIDQKGFPVYNYDNDGCAVSVKECDLCEKTFDDDNKVYSKGLFIVALIVGLITLGIGFWVLSVEPVGSALLASGIGGIFYGSARNWDYFSDILRFVLLLVALVVLVWFALRLNKTRKESSMKEVKEKRKRSK